MTAISVVKREAALGLFVLGVASIVLSLLWVVFSAEVFLWRNPKANSRVLLMHPVAVLTFHRLPAYQESAP